MLLGVMGVSFVIKSMEVSLEDDVEEEEVDLDDKEVGQSSSASSMSLLICTGRERLTFFEGGQSSELEEENNEQEYRNS